MSTVKPRHNLISGAGTAAVTLAAMELADSLTNGETSAIATLIAALISGLLGCAWKTISLEVTLKRNGTAQDERKPHSPLR